MENASTARTHPLVLAAAASVLVVSAAGTAALMGWLPATRGASQAAEPVATVSAIPTIPPLVATAPEAPAVPEAKPAPEASPVPQVKPALPKPAARKTVAPKPVEASKPIEEPVRIVYEPPVPPPPVAILRPSTPPARRGPASPPRHRSVTTAAWLRRCGRSKRPAKVQGWARSPAASPAAR